MNFAENLKVLRTRRNLTQEELAEALNFKKSTISMYELGNRFPDLENLVRLSDFFNVTTDALLGVRGASIAPNRLDIVRKDRRQNEQTIAKYLCVSEIQYIEYEKNFAPPEVIRKLSDYYGIDYEFLAGYDYKLQIPIALWPEEAQEDYKEAPLDRHKRMMEYKYGKLYYIIPESDKPSLSSEKESQVLVAYRSHPEMQSAVDKLLGIDATAPNVGNIAADVAEETKDFIASRQSIGTK